VPFIRRRDKNAADGAAVDAAGTPVPGLTDGRRWSARARRTAPMLCNGENVGAGRGQACDIAVDPMDLIAPASRRQISMIAMADR
jgi:fructose-1,6-bisphosphatase II